MDASLHLCTIKYVDFNEMCKNHPQIQLTLVGNDERFGMTYTVQFGGRIPT